MEQVMENNSYLDDLYFIQNTFCQKVHHILKSRIKGSIFVGIKNDVLLFSVRKDTIFFEMNVENMTDRVLDGEKADVFAQMLFDSYKSYILEYIFW